MFVRLSLLGIALLVFSACDSADPVTPDPEPPQAASILPLAVGNTWQMDGTVVSYIRNDTTFNHSGRLFVAEAREHNGETWYRVDGEHATRVLFGGLYTEREDGIWHSNRQDAVEQEYLLYKYPAQAGDEYTASFSGHFMTIRVLSTNTEITTASGTHEAIHYEIEYHTASFGQTSYTLRDVYFDRYLIPGLGFGQISNGYIRHDPNEEQEANIMILHSLSTWELVSADLTD